MTKLLTVVARTVRRGNRIVARHTSILVIVEAARPLYRPDGFRRYIHHGLVYNRPVYSQAKWLVLRQRKRQARLNMIIIVIKQHLVEWPRLTTNTRL